MARRVTGTYTGRYGEFPLEGTLKGNAIQFSLSLNAEGMTVTMAFTGEVAADSETMKGKATIGETGRRHLDRCATKEELEH